MKIAIIGCPGSGKSTVSSELYQILKLPLYHLDQYYFKPGWVRCEREEFEIIHNQLCDRPEWIIDGTAISFLDYRVAISRCYYHP